MAKFAYRVIEGSRQVEFDQPNSDEHLCISMYPVTASAQAVVKRDGALLTQDEVQKHCCGHHGLPDHADADTVAEVDPEQQQQQPRAHDRGPMLVIIIVPWAWAIDRGI